MPDGIFMVDAHLAEYTWHVSMNRTAMQGQVLLPRTAVTQMKRRHLALYNAPLFIDHTQ